MTLEASDTESVTAVPPLRWGVIGATSTIARVAVIPAIISSDAAQLVAVATRGAADHRSASLPGVADVTAYERDLGVRVSPHYQDVLDDPEVEAVYIPLPNGLHAPWTTRAAAAGKHVLCEKPLSTDPTEAAEMVAACEAAGVALAEAYMTAFHPRVRRLAEFVASGGLGELRFAHSAFTFTLGRPNDYRWDPAQGGGALADVGIYCLSPLVAAAGGRPVSLAAAGNFTSVGVDASLGGWMDFGDGFCASFECSFEASERQHLEFVGTRATVSIERAFTPGVGDTWFDVREREGTVTRIDTGGANPYAEMIGDFAAVVRGGKQPARTPHDAVDLIGLADAFRRSARDSATRTPIHAAAATPP